MIKNKNTISSNRFNKKSIRPYSAGMCLKKNTIPTNELKNIIISIEKNVKDLKVYHATQSQDKSKKAYRITKGLARNSSKTNLISKNQDKSQNDIFQIRNEYLKVNGKITNNIIQLYEFYKKNIEKRQKSTRIMASMELSNGGQSISGGKQSLLKHSQPHREFTRKQKDSSKIEQKNEESNNLSSLKQQMNPKKVQKLSSLANGLISNGCYDMNGIANILHEKRFRFLKQKQQSLIKENNDKNTRLPQIIDIKQIQANKQNNINRENIIKIDQNISLGKQMQSNVDLTRSPQFFKKPESSAKKTQQNHERVQQNSKSFQCSSISKQQKDIENKIFQNSSFKKNFENIDKKSENKNEIKELIQLQQSPIASKSKKDFEKSKFYVKPIPLKKPIENQNSLTLRSTSGIVDIDSLPFDL